MMNFRGWRTFPISVIALVVLLWMPSRMHAQADAKSDVLVFTNGDQLTGSIVRGVGNSILFKSDAVGEVTVPLAKIKELRSKTAFVVLPKEIPSKPVPVVAGQIAVADGKITLMSSSSSEQIATPDNEVGFIVDQATYEKERTARRSFFSGWGGSISGGATVLQATQYGQTYNAAVALSRTIPMAPYFRTRNRTLFNLSETYGKLSTPLTPPVAGISDLTVKQNIFHTDAERDEYFTKKVFAFAGLGFDHNFSQGLSLQQTYGGGLGWTPILDAVQQLDLKADVHYTKQHFIVPVPLPAGFVNQDQNLIGSAFGEDYRRALPLKVALTQFATFVPAWNNTNAYAATGGLTLTLPVIRRFAVNLSLQDSFINNPAFGFKKNSLQFITGVSYTLR